MFNRTFILAIVLGLAVDVLPARQNPAAGEQREEYFRKWLKEDVVYIITPEEKATFEKLNTVEERESFIEQFWKRRDPDPRTEQNEYKEEFYRRIAYVNEKYGMGAPGWKTDRGRIYITYGPPNSIEKHATGGIYERPMNEGGGTTQAYPYEVWQYRYIEGVGSNIEIEFVDRSLSGDYRIAIRPEEKDALLFTPGGGATFGEVWGDETRASRVLAFDMMRPPGAQTSQNYREGHRLDNPFERLQQYYNLQRPPQIQYKDLQAAVSTSVRYNLLPFDSLTGFMRVAKNAALLPVTLKVANKHLTYQRLSPELYRASLMIYGQVETMTKTLAYEFEDTVTSDIAAENYPREALETFSLYQKELPLRPGRYKLRLVLKDAGQPDILSSVDQGITVPAFDESQLQSSSLVIADSLREARPGESMPDPYIWSTYRVYPNVERLVDMKRGEVALFFEVYNMAVDAVSQKTDLELRFLFESRGLSVPAPPIRLSQKFLGDRVCIFATLPISQLKPGSYRIKVEVNDRIMNRRMDLSETFELK